MEIDFRLLANLSIQNLKPYLPGKPINEVERELGITSSIKLASNENPLGPSPQVALAVQDLLANAHIYPDASCFEIKQEIAKFLSVKPTQITMGNGSENILELIIKSYLHAGDSTVFSQYAFLTIPLLIKSYDVRAKIVPANPWGHDIDAMIKAVDKTTRVVFLINPNNPTGTYTTEKEFQKFINNIPPHVIIVVDEAYSEYANHSDYPRTINYLNSHPNLIVCKTFSKIYALAGLRVGYAVSSEAIADILNRVRLPFNVNAIAAKAACAAIKDQTHVERSRIMNQEGLKQLNEELLKMKLPVLPSLGNFITIDVNDGKYVYQKLLEQGVIIRPLSMYDLPRHIRVTIGTYEQNERFLASLKNVI